MIIGDDVVINTSKHNETPLASQGPVANRLESDLSCQSFQLLVMGLFVDQHGRWGLVGQMMVPKMEDPFASP